MILSNAEVGLDCGSGSQVINNTLCNNIKEGIDCYYSETTLKIDVKNSILWGNNDHGNQIRYHYPANALLRYCDIENGWTGGGWATSISIRCS